MMRKLNQDCPLCKLPANANVQSGKYYFECPNCGEYSMSEEAYEDLESTLRPYSNDAALVSHVIRYRQLLNKEQPFLKNETIANILAQNTLPQPQQQANNLILYIGKKYNKFGEKIKIVYNHCRAVIGAIDDENVKSIIEHSAAEELIKVDPRLKDVLYHETHRETTIRLSMKGWERFEELKRGHSDSRLVFMAMEFKEENMWTVYKNHFKHAVEQTGFTLETVAENQKAGLIDDAIRVKILNSKFVIADLTHHNNGAYWEAGYAEGLGKPVIYTCEESVFDNPDTKPHFDTNHHLTIKWNVDKMNKAEEQLKNTIRSTLPAEAKMHDN